MSDRLVAEAVTYTTQQTQGMSIRTLSRILTGNSNSRAALRRADTVISQRLVTGYCVYAEVERHHTHTHTYIRTYTYILTSQCNPLKTKETDFVSSQKVGQLQ
jgi:hypothetical protein